MYWLSSSAPNLRGYKDVTIRWFVERRGNKLFGPGGSLGVAYQDVIKDYDPDHDGGPYAEDALEELFTESEAKAFAKFLNAHRSNQYADHEIDTEWFPIPNNLAGYGANALGGSCDNLCISDAADYDLPFKIYGYYDLWGCEFDASLPGARRAVEGVVVKADGSIEPWHDGDEPSTGDRRVAGQPDEAEKTARWFLQQENAAGSNR
jgi:hypothetical protein